MQLLIIIIRTYEVTKYFGLNKVTCLRQTPTLLTYIPHYEFLQTRLSDYNSHYSHSYFHLQYYQAKRCGVWLGRVALRSAPSGELGKGVRRSRARRSCAGVMLEFAVFRVKLSCFYLHFGALSC